MKKKINISPVGLKGNQINERMKQLMGIGSINESKSNIVVELTKVGPDGKAYAIIRENHEWYIKTTDKKKGLVAEDFKYIGGLMNKKSEAYPSYAKAIKHLNLKFKSLAEAHNFEGEINVFENDNLLSEDFAGFSNEGGSGFSGKGNLEGQEALWEEDEMTDDAAAEEADELTEVEKAVMAMTEEEEEVVESEEECDTDTETLTEHKLSILNAMKNMDAIIDSLTEGKVKKKVYTIK
jgi:hypothetical protein